MDTLRNYKLILNNLNKINYKMIIKQLLELCVLICLTYFAVLYANREFEIPFFPRDTDNQIVEIDIPRNTVPAIIITEAQTEAPTNVLHIIDPEALVPPEQSDEQDNTEPDFEPLAELAALGYLISDGIYEHGEYKLAQIIPEHTPVSSHRAVEPFMDYLIIRDRSDRAVLADASGRIIDPRFAESGMEILALRDSGGRTVFRRRDIVDTDADPIVETVYYIYNTGLREFEPIEFDEALADRGINFMYPSYFGAPANNLETFRNSSGLWGFNISETGRQLIGAQYSRAFNFSEDIGSAYITNWTEWRHIGNLLYFFDETGRVINNQFYGPDPIDEDTNRLGFYYFDHGLTRVIEKLVNPRRTAVVEQREFIIDKNWREFYTPIDYKIIAYSNGMILLEKDGSFGFMNYLGEWVAQPIYTYAEPFFEGLAVIGMTDGKKMLIDTQGNILAKMQYDHISNCTGGIVALFSRDNGWTILNKVRRP